ncbi:uncharacterized protein LOC143550005 [Bidens hawaiensis]|uniref:uncharacterized protein LOC143550005 n=1 Tax=Bidens hawaiensis TaxID=980011 RepID=UPI00404AD44D
MDPVIRSRKRKNRPSESDPFGGIFTRSKTQIYFHRHRSGYSRSDSNRSRGNNNNIKLMKGIKAESVVKHKEPEAVSSVKDLRARRVFSPATADVEADVNVCKQSDGNPVGSVVDSEKSVGDVINCGLEADVAVADAGGDVKMTSAVVEVEENKTPVANEVADSKDLMNKSQSSVASLRGGRKVFVSLTSFNYRRLLPYLMDSENDDSSSFEILEAALPKSLESSNPVPNVVALKDEETGPVFNSSKLADGLLNNSNSVNAGLVSTVETSDAVQKSQEDVVNDSLESEQTTPPDSNIYSKSKVDNVSGALVKPASKLGLKSCSRLKALQTPTSFSHRRLLPFLMSVAEDYSGPLKDDQSLKPEKAIEQNEQPPTQFLVSTTADEASNSPTSTLVPVDASLDKTNLVALVSNDNILDANVPNKETGESILQLAEAVKSDSCIKMEQSPPKLKLTCVEEPPLEATPLCIVQSQSAELQIKVKESPQQYPMPILETQVESIKSGILKRTPRGCRGICNCLNCTSFRLHAERSFEFSKNQMHDAEEVALELINDLKYLRNVLEASSASSSFDTVKQKQAKEACAKALYKEQEARARLAQMNEDLSIHCRSMNLLRPKVTFANKIEEKVISKDGICGKKSF